MAASTLLLRSAYKASSFSEISPLPTYFFSLQILPMERSSDSQNLKKNHESDFGLHQSVSVLKYIHI